MEFKEYLDWYDKCRADRRGHRKSGVYGWFVGDDCFYVGQSRELYSRFVSHAEEFAKVRQKDIPSKQKYILLKDYIERLEWCEIEYTKDLDAAEAKWIEFYKPIFNVETPYGRQHFRGKQSDIDLYMSGVINYEDLQMLIDNGG